MSRLREKATATLLIAIFMISTIAIAYAPTPNSELIDYSDVSTKWPRAQTEEEETELETEAESESDDEDDDEEEIESDDESESEDEDDDESQNSGIIPYIMGGMIGAALVVLVLIVWWKRR